MHLLIGYANSIGQVALPDPHQPAVPPHLLTDVNIDGMCDAGAAPILGPMAGS
jgi:hypothetical protein